MPDYFSVIIWFVLTNNMYTNINLQQHFFFEIIMRVYNISFLLKKKIIKYNKPIVTYCI